MARSAHPSIEIISPLRHHAFAQDWYRLSDESHFWFRWRIEALKRQLCDVNISLGEPLRAFEIGCGTGILRSQLEAAMAWEVDVTDLDYEALCQVRPGRGRILYYDILEEKTGFKERYDLVILFDVLEHIRQTQPFINSLLFHLRVGGYLLVNVPALQTLTSRYDEAAGHLRRYDKNSLREEFSNWPLSVSDIRYWGMTNVLVVLARKLWLAFLPSRDAGKLIKQGFRPPCRMMNEALLGLMKLEVNTIRHPFLGSSLLMIAQKTVS